MNIEQRMNLARKQFAKDEDARKLSASSDARSFPPYPSVEVAKQWKPAQSPSMYRTIQKIMEDGAVMSPETGRTLFRTYN